MTASQPLRVCMLTTFYPPWSFGGDAVHVQRLSRALAERGHEVTVVHSAESHRALADATPPVGDSDGAVRLVPIDAGRGALSPALTHVSGRPVLTRRQLREALRGPFDVLHYHNPSLLGGPALLGMGEGLRLYTLHEQWLVCPTHVLFRYRREVCVKPHCWSCQLSYRRPPQLWRGTGLLERAVGALDALIAPSRTSAALHERFAGQVRIEHIPHFVEQPAQAAPRDPEAAAYFLCVGRLEPVKGFSRAIDAFRQRHEELLIAGAGALESALRRRAHDLPHVRFLGEVDRSRLGALYRGARAVIVPSAGHEAFGLVAVEAFAHGTPAIVPAFGALEELARDSGAALTYRDDAELHGALTRLAGDDALRAELGDRGRRAVRDRWSVERHLDRYLGLVAELARARGDVPLAERAAA